MYKQINENTVQRDDGSFLSTEHPVYLAWLSEGNTPEPADPVPAQDYAALRAAAYRDESDPIFFQEQRGEVPAGTWLAKVEEIRQRYPV